MWDVRMIRQASHSGGESKPMNALKQQIQYIQQMLITDKENIRMLWGNDQIWYQ